MKGWRTLAVAMAVAALGAVDQAGVATVVPDGYDGLALSAVGGLMAVLRAITTTPLGGAPASGPGAGV